MSYLQSILSANARRPILIDGAYGSEFIRIQNDASKSQTEAAAFSLIKENALPYDFLNLLAPETVYQLHKSYIGSGAALIRANSFNSTNLEYLPSGFSNQARTLNIEACKIANMARNELEQEILLGASIGPPRDSLTRNNDIKKQYYLSYINQLDTILSLDAVDILFFETIYEMEYLKLIIKIINKLSNGCSSFPPTVLSLSPDKNFRLLSGESFSEFYQTCILCPNLLSIGINCGYGSSHILMNISDVETTSLKQNISIIPNAGIPDRYGKYPESADDFSENLLSITKILPNTLFIGGCCGAGPKYIEKISARLSK
jgi:methionine synthase I (cobalamin-dependent)